MKITRTQAAYLAVKIKSLAAEAVIIRKDERKQRAAHKSLEATASALLAEAKAAESPAPDVSRLVSRSAIHRQTWLGLKGHRRSIVRDQARASLLAYGYLRGVPYLAMEAKCHLPPDWNRVAHVATRFGLERVTTDALLAWSVVVPGVAVAA